MLISYWSHSLVETSSHECMPHLACLQPLVASLGPLHCQKGKPGNSRDDAGWRRGTLPEDLSLVFTALTPRMPCFYHQQDMIWHLKGTCSRLGTEAHWKTISLFWELDIGFYSEFVEGPETKQQLKSLCTIINLFWNTPRMGLGVTNKLPLWAITPFTFLHKIQYWRWPIPSAWVCPTALLVTFICSPIGRSRRATSKLSHGSLFKNNKTNKQINETYFQDVISSDRREGGGGFGWEVHVTQYLVIIQPQRQRETFCAVAENDSTWSSSTQIKSGETIGQMEKGNATLQEGREEKKNRERQKLARNIKAASTTTGERDDATD